MILDAKNCIFPSFGGGDCRQPAAAQECAWVRLDLALELFVSDLATGFEAHGGNPPVPRSPVYQKKGTKSCSCRPSGTWFAGGIVNPIAGTPERLHLLSGCCSQCVSGDLIDSSPSRCVSFLAVGQDVRVGGSGTKI